MRASSSYAITVQSHLGSNWSPAFPDLTIRNTGAGQTILSGPALDQAALLAVLAKMLDLNLKLIAVNLVEPEPSPR